MRTAAICGLVGLLCASANAATINSKQVDGLNIVTITGKIEPGDSDTFNRVVAPLTGRTVVFLASPGGEVTNGLDIGLSIRRHGFATGVLNNNVCASVCGWMWLAGTTRLTTEDSKIGFHSAFSKEDGSTSGPANALAGAYLREMGLSYEAIFFVTQSPPDQITWLHPSDAKRVGIAYTLIPKEVLAQKPQEPKFGSEEDVPVYRQPTTPIPAPAAPVAPPARSSQTDTREQQAMRLVVNYNEYWSNAGINVEGLSQYYAPQVNFYGGVISREKVMVEKRKFSLRWPVRHYTITPNSMAAQCDNEGCSVIGVVNWDATSQERGAHSTGSANFAYRIVNGVIVSENGSVLTRQASTAEQEQAATTPAYAQGRQARIDYEEWITALAEGAYKDGALFWAAHRSDKPQPSCNGQNDWQVGCLASRARLTVSDLRRNSDKNFWYGWNSL